MSELEIRPPRPAEYAICRMLLPEESKRGTAAQYLLAFRDGGTRVVGAASYLPNVGVIHGISIRVIRTDRRAGIGSLLLRTIEETARSRKAGLLLVKADLSRDPDAAPFFLHHGYSPGSGIKAVEGQLSAGIDWILALAERLRRSEGFASKTRVVAMKEAPQASVTALYLSELARDPFIAPWSLLDEVSHQRFARSPVLLVGDRVVGFLLGDIQGELVKVPARIVHPEFQGGPANLLLLERALCIARDSGVKRIQFEIPKDNRDTERIAERFAARVVRVTEQYWKRLPVP